TKEEILSSNPKHLFAPHSLDDLGKNIDTIVKKGFLTHEMEITLSDGTFLPVELSSSLMTVGDERFILTSGREIAERVESRKEKEERMKEKTLLLDILTHDLRNYISVLWSCISHTLDEEDATIEEIKASVLRAKVSLAKTDALLDDISVLMKKDIEFTYELRPVNILNNIHKCHTNLEDMYPLKDIQINIDRINPKLNVLADMLFEQLLFNILSNSVKNTPSQAVRIDIGTEEKQDGKIVISIADFGKGITQDKRRKIFERYGEFRKKGSGSGLGLFIIQTLIERYKGKVWIENTIKGDYTKGTTFKLELRKTETEMFEFA
ncbi:MAG: PAS domain S-box protein, partial [Candidatus Heimdallarchaeota archaeon]|nr:PAS domain S-box protein [Candidatus Heimdallarchaeota archaeon]MCK5144396.1 PAS domain S-box protein [Candidatus Heimdallarchaeota archaeon]